jgi:hypothetical protein
MREILRCKDWLLEGLLHLLEGPLDSLNILPKHLGGGISIADIAAIIVVVHLMKLKKCLV